MSLDTTEILSRTGRSMSRQAFLVIIFTSNKLEWKAFVLFPSTPVLLDQDEFHKQNQSITLQLNSRRCFHKNLLKGVTSNNNKSNREDPKEWIRGVKVYLPLSLRFPQPPLPEVCFVGCVLVLSKLLQLDDYYLFN